MSTATLIEKTKSESELASFIPYRTQLTPAIVRLHSGEYCFTFKMAGAAHESADISTINAWHEQFAQLLRNIADTHIAVWTHTVRRKYNTYPEGEPTNAFGVNLNAQYRQRFTQDEKFINELYITILYKPRRLDAKGLFDGLLKKPRTDAEIREDIGAVEELIRTVGTSLYNYDPELLKVYEKNGHLFSEQLEFYAYLIDGEHHPFPVPRADISDVFGITRPIFGAGGLIALKGPIKTQMAAAITIREYPRPTAPGLLNELLTMPFELVLSQSFTFLEKQGAVQRMSRQHGRMVNAGDLAQSQVEEIGDALDQLMSNEFVMGTHSLTLLVKSPDRKGVDTAVSLAGTALADVGMKWGREDIATPAAFFSQLPGNFKYRPRLADITSRNFAGFAANHNFPIGRIKGAQWGDAVIAFKTTSGAPYYFNFHAVDPTRAIADPNHREPANTVVMGKTGTGKTVLAGMLLAMATKFNAPGKRFTAVVLDKDLGMSVAVRAMGGRYYPIKRGERSGFNPFQLPATQATQMFLEKLVKVLVRSEAHPFTTVQESEISNAIRGVMSAPKPLRRLGAMMEFLDPTDPNGIRPRLQRWCGNGTLAWLFDNDEDTIDVDNTPIIGFDVTEFLEEPEIRTPTILYLFHRIESLIDGRRIPIFIDEFPKVLGDEAFRDLIENKLVTIRKQDGFLVMFSQSPEQLMRSPIAYALVGQTSTKIFLPNPQADRKSYIEDFKLSEKEYTLIKNLGEKSRRFLIKQGEGSVVAEMNLAGMDDEIAVLSGNTETSLLVERLVKEHGPDPANWLSLFHSIRKGELE